MITIELTDEQAFVLRKILDKVGGYSKGTAREHSDAILDQLVSQGVEYDDDNEMFTGTLIAI